MNRIAHLFTAESARPRFWVLEATLQRGPRTGEHYIVKNVHNQDRTFATYEEAAACADRLHFLQFGTARYSVQVRYGKP